MKKTQSVWVIWIILLVIASGAMFYFSVVKPGIPIIDTSEEDTSSTDSDSPEAPSSSNQEIDPLSNTTELGAPEASSTIVGNE